LPFVPEVANLLARESPDTLLLAAGGIADGRGLAAALMLGADGVLVGTRFWASREALVHPNHHAAAIAATGDETVRSSLPDIARRLDWPKPFDIRVGDNAFIAKWRGRDAELRAADRGRGAGLSRGLHCRRSRQSGGPGLRRGRRPDLGYPFRRRDRRADGGGGSRSSHGRRSADRELN
jgi:hypothetical protein